jgi:hypothetical protein
MNGRMPTIAGMPMTTIATSSPATLSSAFFNEYLWSP